MRQERSGSWIKIGCLGLAGLIVVALVVFGIASGIAVKQNRSASFESEQAIYEVPQPVPGGDRHTDSLRLDLDVHTAGVSLRPLEAGQPIRVDADYDPRSYALRQARERVEGEEVLTVELRPLGSKLIALLRAKLGGRPPMLRIGLPPEIRLQIGGDLKRSFAAMELGGLSVEAMDLHAEEGGIKVSFDEPLAAPMDSMRILVDRGALSIASLGNASPRESVFLQHLGAVDLDLRGAWARDADVRLIGGAAGGSVWLPNDVRINGLDESRGLRLREDSELRQPTLNLSITEKMGRFLVME